MYTTHSTCVKLIQNSEWLVRVTCRLLAGSNIDETVWQCAYRISCQECPQTEVATSFNQIEPGPKHCSTFGDMRVKNSFYKVVLSNSFTCVLLNDQTYPGCQRNFFQGRRERSVIPNQRSGTKKKASDSHDPRTSFPCHQIRTESVLVRWLDITFEGVTDWTNRKTGTRQLLRQAALRDFGSRAWEAKLFRWSMCSFDAFTHYNGF